MAVVSGNHTNYGQAIGILMLETYFPRIPGDIGNATSFPFPVRYYIVRGTNGNNVAKTTDPAAVEKFIEGARALEREGVRAIVTSCGFTAAFHRELADAVSIPVFSSSLVQVGLVYNMLRRDQKVGIITADSESLGERHFRGVGIENVPKVVVGMENTRFCDMFYAGSQSIDVEETAREMRARARQLITEHPEIGAIVLECTNMPPFALDVQEETGLPVFDVVTLTKYVYSAVVQQRYHGFL